MRTLSPSQFACCRALAAIAFELNSALTQFPRLLFDRCHSLASICIPRNVAELGVACFQDCRNLALVLFEPGSQLGAIGPFAFSTCRSLISICIPRNVAELGVSCFQNCWKALVLFEPGSQLGAIGQFAFSDCRSLISICIPSGVGRIAPFCFYSCRSLRQVEFADTSPASPLKRLELTVFRDCSSLESITIPGSVVVLSFCCFYGCSSLRSVTFTANSRLRWIRPWAFGECPAMSQNHLQEGVPNGARVSALATHSLEGRGADWMMYDY
ncbi:MAG: leucine-rich repeat domain-containing protein [Holosporaceae bacterium]|nr:leucine-rich repeat domain-containing protein [Holosporaceae bacterium]